MPEYIVTENGIYRNGLGGYQRVAELHCTKEEAREIAEDLGATIWTEGELRNILAYGGRAPVGRDPTCANPYCDHFTTVHVEQITGKRHLSI